MDTLPLTALCCICHSAEWRYRCPRCSTKTCSLPCVTKHKQRASCNGKRDPAAYQKKNQLQTEAGIDHDFNFLTGVERAFDKADHDAKTRGISLGGKPASYPKHSHQNVERALVESEVDIRRAPKGMSRSRLNRTEYINRSPHYCLNWTVEWFFPEGLTIVRNCFESLTLEQACKRVRPVNQGKKRKREAKQAARQRDANNVKHTGPRGTETKQLITGPEESSVEEQAPAGAQEPFAESTLLEPTPPLTPEIDQAPPLPDNHAPSRPKKHESPTYHYYLHKPLCPGETRVLIPLDADATLRDALFQKTVLEFPTIYALREAPERLPVGFVTENQWRKRTSGVRVVDEHQPEGSSVV